MTVSLRHQAEEATLTAAEYRDWIEVLATSRDTKAQRSPEQLGLMRLRLERKEAIAETLGRAADRADAGRTGEEGRAAE